MSQIWKEWRKLYWGHSLISRAGIMLLLEVVLIREQHAPEPAIGRPGYPTIVLFGALAVFVAWVGIRVTPPGARAKLVGWWCLSNGLAAAGLATYETIRATPVGGNAFRHVSLTVALVGVAGLLVAIVGGVIVWRAPWSTRWPSEELLPYREPPPTPPRHPWPKQTRRERRMHHRQGARGRQRNA
jgi:hypothetical protein